MIYTESSNEQGSQAVMELEIVDPVRTAPVRGYEGIYEVTESGRVWSVRRTTERGGRPMSVGGKWMTNTEIKGGYSRVNLRRGDHNKHTLVHRLVWEAFNKSDLGDLQVDHIDRNPRNNHFSNLRPATASQNRQNNHGKPEGRVSKYKGITKHASKWRAKCGQVDLGLHPTQEAAARAYDESAREQYGEFAQTNFTK